MCPNKVSWLRDHLSRQPVVAFLAAFSTCLFFLYPAGDADLGWHLRYGQHFLNTGRVLFTNTFSFVLPDYRWVNHSWAYDPLVAVVFTSFGFFGLSLAGAVLIALSFYLVTRSLPPLALLVSVLVFAFFGQHLLATGLRSQLISLLFTAYLWYRLLYGRRFYDLVFLFFLWANLHGQFLFGLALFWLYTLARFVTRAQPLTRLRHLLLVAVLSTVICLLNPFGPTLFATALSHLSSPVTANIFEWMPWELHTPRMVALLLYSFYLVVVLKSQPLKKSLPTTLVYLALMVLGLRSRRLIPFYVLVTLPVVSRHLSARLLSRFPVTSTKVSLILIGLMVLMLTSLLPNRHLFAQDWSSYCTTNVLCSESLVDYLNRHQLEGNLFNSYRLGGHLLYRAPHYRVFIDGRMTLWQTAAGRFPFLDYLAIVHASPQALALIDSYQLEYFALHPQFELAQLLDRLAWPVLFDAGVVRLYQNPN